MFKTSTDVTIKATYALQKVVSDSHECKSVTRIAKSMFKIMYLFSLLSCYILYLC